MGLTKRRRMEALAALAFILPNMAGFLAFTLFPVVVSLALSFFNWSPLHGTAAFGETAEFVGLGNFWGVIGAHSHPDGSAHLNDYYFWRYLGNTIFLMFGIPFSILGSLFIANLLSTKIKGAALFMIVFFLPSVVSGVPTFMIWSVLLNPDSGLVNAALGLVGIEGPLWLYSMAWAKPSLVLMGWWASIGGYNMVLYLAALQSIPNELYEAAEIDGAGAFQKFRHITWPMVSPTTFFIFTMSLIHGFQGGFAAAYIMTEGGPAGSTTMLSYYIYNLAFSRRFNMGYASAVAWVLFLITLVLSIINWRYGRRRVHGEFDV